MRDLLINSLSTFIAILNFLIFARAILSWFRPPRYNKLYDDITRALDVLTEPILAPIRRLLPLSGMGIDFSPLVAMILLTLVRDLLAFVIRLIL